MRPSPQKLLVQAETDAFLVTDLTNIRYLTGFALSSGALLVLPRRIVLFTDNRYHEAAAMQVLPGVSVFDHGALAETLAAVPVCGFEAENVTVERKARWKRQFQHTKFVQTVGVVHGFRRQKSSEELLLMRRAKRVTEELLRRVPAALRKGVTERELAQKLLLWALELGAEGLAFEPIVAFGTHTSRPHHAPTPRALRKGHIVQIDVGAKVRGYCADASEVFFTASLSREQERIYRTLHAAKDAAATALHPGVTTHALDRIARQVLGREGLEEAFCHALGHGIGLEVHEGVTLTQKRPAAMLLKSEVVTIEPGVYFPGRFGMRVEEAYVVR